MTLPSAGPLRLAGIDVGSGRPIAPDPSYAASAESAPVLWLGDKAPNDGGKRWSALRRAFPTTGLWPLLLGGLDRQPERPFESGELLPMPVDERDAREILAECWEGIVPSEFDEEPEVREPLEPFGQEFPGLAVVGGTDRKDDVIERVAKEISKGRRIGLVEAPRPADTLAAIGWLGTVNVHEVSTISAILRSWEDRFGVVVVGLDFDTLTLAVRRPPTTDDESLRVAAEHHAFCSDNISQGVGSIKAYAKALRKASRWDFWWD